MLAQKTDLKAADFVCFYRTEKRIVGLEFKNRLNYSTKTFDFKTLTLEK